MRHPWFLLLLLTLLATSCRPAASDDGDANEQVSAGQALYEANCAACHGLRGEGAADWKQPADDGRMPPPPHTAEGHTWHHPDGLLYAIVADGGTADDSAMPAFKDQLTHTEIIAVLEYIKTFWPDDIRGIQQRTSEGLPYPTAPAP